MARSNRISLSRFEGEQNFKLDLADAPSGIGATNANIQRLLRSLDFIGWSSHEESGRLDRRALTRFASGSANIFSRRMHVEAETSAVSVLIDCSDSMCGGRIKNAQKIAVHLATTLQRSRVPFAITGFYSANGSYAYADPNKFGEGGMIETPTFLPFKPWNKSLHACASLVGNISKCCDGGTPDYSAIYNSIDDLSRRSESRKILFLITDANGYTKEHMRHLQTLADKLGVVIIAIGIRADDVTDCFVNAVSVRDVSELASVAFNAMLKTVQRKTK